MPMLTEPPEESRLAELVDLVIGVVIGVDTHTDTHTAAVVVAATGAVLATVTSDRIASDGRPLPCQICLPCAHVGRAAPAPGLLSAASRRGRSAGTCPPMCSG